MNPKSYKIMLVAGEISGDTHAAKLVAALRDNSFAASFEFFGATGTKMREMGVETVINSDDLSIVGLPEIAHALPIFWRAFQTLKREATKRKPDAVILIDFPDFNLKLAKSLRKQGLKIIYYISPQLWAWRRYRVKTIGKYVDLLLTILPFEEDWYAKHGISHVEYVGNPLAGEVKSTLTKAEFCAKNNLDLQKPIVALLGGSRRKEIAKILPVLLEAACLMKKKKADLQFVIALASTRNRAEIESAIADAKRDLPKFTIIQDETREALNAADVAAITSGTATLETAIIGTPMAIVYKTSALNYGLLRPLISVEHFGLINLIAEERIAKELIQKDFTAQTLSDELLRLLQPETNKKMRKKLKEVTVKLGKGGAARRAAEAIMRELKI